MSGSTVNLLISNQWYPSSANSRKRSSNIKRSNASRSDAISAGTSVNPVINLLSRRNSTSSTAPERSLRRHFTSALSKYNSGTYQKAPKLIELHKELFKTEPSNLHNSLIDVLACFRCFYKMVHNEDIVNETTHKTFYNYYNEKCGL